MRSGIRGFAVTLPRVHRVTQGGVVYRYHRATRAALPDLPETHPDFVAAWAIEDAKTRADTPPRAAVGTLDHAIETLRRGAKFRGLSATYRAMMAREFEALRRDYGSVQVRGLRPKHLNADMNKLDPVAANKRLRAWRLICAHMVQSGLDTDPSAGIKKRAEKTDGHTPWTAVDVARFRERWPVGTSARGCFELLWWTGLRVSDAVLASWSMIDAGGVLHIRQTKTGGAAWIPWTANLPAWARDWAADRDTAIAAVCTVAPGGWTMLEAGGRARSSAGLSNLISAAARSAGLTGRTAHGLRKTRLTLIAESGGSAHAIMGWGGHKSLSEAEHYTRTAQLRGLVIGPEQEQNTVKSGPQPVKFR